MVSCQLIGCRCRQQFKRPCPNSLLQVLSYSGIKVVQLPLEAAARYNDAAGVQVYHGPNQWIKPPPFARTRLNDAPELVESYQNHQYRDRVDPPSPTRTVCHRRLCCRCWGGWWGSRGLLGVIVKIVHFGGLGFLESSWDSDGTEWLVKSITDPAAAAVNPVIPMAAASDHPHDNTSITLVNMSTSSSLPARWRSIPPSKEYTGNCHR